jgi:glyoxylase-like metal-dependent hydrolase (beta-lactamase superfamily II)
LKNPPANAATALTVIATATKTAKSDTLILGGVVRPFTLNFTPIHVSGVVDGGSGVDHQHVANTMRHVCFTLFVLAVTSLGLRGEEHSIDQVDTVDENNGIEVLRLRPNFFMIAGAGANIAVQVGKLGAVVVDTGTGQATDRVLQEIRKLTPLPIRYIINTSADPDHVEGNEKLSAAGQSLIPATGQTGGIAITDALSNGGAAAILATDNVAARMSAPSGQKSAYPVAAQPSDTFSDDEKDTFLNGEAIQIFAQRAAHTDGDSVAFFRRSDVVVAGDILDTTRFPVIDLSRGGSIQGEIDALNHIIGLTVTELPLVWQEGGTLVIPGHGRICDEADVVEYRDMVTIIRDVIQDEIAKGKTLEQIKMSDPAGDYRTRYGSDTGAWTTDMFVEAVYRSLTQKK